MPRRGTLDPRLLLRGYDGELWDGEGNFIATVNTFQGQVNVTNSDYQPAGQALVVATLQSYTVTLTATETTVHDPLLLERFLRQLEDDDVPEYNFIGVLRARGRGRRDGRYAFRKCVPDGSIDVINVAPGDVLNRAWSFRSNEPPDLRSVLGT